jgi:hypothetical protein
MILLINGISSWYNPGEEHLFSLYLNITSGSAVILAVIYEQQFVQHDRRKIISWVDTFAGIMIITDALNRYNPKKSFQPASLLFLAGIVTLAKRLLLSKLPDTGCVIFNDRNINVRFSLLRKQEFRWDEISSVQAIDSAIRVITTDGRNHTIRLWNIENRQEIIAKLNEFAQSKNITVHN